MDSPSLCVPKFHNFELCDFSWVTIVKCFNCDERPGDGTDADAFVCKICSAVLCKACQNHQPPDIWEKDIICQDKSGFWYHAEIIDRKGTSVKVHYKRWASRWDEWIECDSFRLAHPGTRPLAEIWGTERMISQSSQHYIERLKLNDPTLRELLLHWNDEITTQYWNVLMSRLSVNKKLSYLRLGGMAPIYLNSFGDNLPNTSITMLGLLFTDDWRHVIGEMEELFRALNKSRVRAFSATLTGTCFEWLGFLKWSKLESIAVWCQNVDRDMLSDALRENIFLVHFNDQNNVFNDMEWIQRNRCLSKWIRAYKCETLEDVKSVLGEAILETVDRVDIETSFDVVGIILGFVVG